MKTRKTLIAITVLIASLFFAYSLALASPGASILYSETDLGGGSWQYDYIISNTSTEPFSIYKVFLFFDNPVIMTGNSIPDGWISPVLWGGTSTNDYLDAMALSSSYYIAQGNWLEGFSFIANTQIGNVPFKAEFHNPNGRNSTFRGTTALVPEPISSILFLTGSATLALRSYLRRKK